MVSRFISVCGLLALCVSAASAARMTASDKVAVLNLHNQVRCNAPNNPTFMPVMSWDTDLEAVAQSWIDTCPMADISSTAPYSMGSNWAGGSGAAFTPLALAQMWAAERSQWTYSTLGTTAVCSGDCGHYTQMVWANSLRVGCATNTNTCSNMAIQLNCVYSPAGNFNNQVPYPIAGNSSPSALKSACNFTSMTTDFLTPYCSSPCQNGGTCSSFEFCKCPSGYSGPFCEIHSSSFPNIYSTAFSCNTNSDCSAAGGGSCCASFLPWGFGQTCANAYPNPSGWTSSGGCSKPSCSSACQNGGTCVDTNLCACPLGSTGAQCQTSTSSTTAAPTTFAPTTFAPTTFAPTTPTPTTPTTSTTTPTSTTTTTTTTSTTNTTTSSTTTTSTPTSTTTTTTRAPNTTQTTTSSTTATPTNITTTTTSTTIAPTTPTPSTNTTNTTSTTTTPTFAPTTFAPTTPTPTTTTTTTTTPTSTTNTTNTTTTTSTTTTTTRPEVNTTVPTFPPSTTPAANSTSTSTPYPTSGTATLLTINALPTYHPGDKIRIEFTGHGTSTGVQVCLIRVPSMQSPYCDVLVTANAFLNYDLGFVDFVLPSDLPCGKYSLAAGFNLLTSTDWHNFAFEFNAFNVALA